MFVSCRFSHVSRKIHVPALLEWHALLFCLKCYDGSYSCDILVLLYYHWHASAHSFILLQEHLDRNSRIPFLLLNERNKMVLFPVHFSPEEATVTATSTNWMGGPCVSTELDFPTNTWVHVGCKVNIFCGFLCFTHQIEVILSKSLHYDSI